MKLEASLKHFSPQGMHISDSAGESDNACIQMVLERWGAWAASEGGNVYYAPTAAGFKGFYSPRHANRAQPAVMTTG